MEKAHAARKVLSTPRKNLRFQVLSMEREPHHLCVGVGAAAMRDQVRVVLVLIREAITARAKATVDILDKLSVL